MIETVRIEGMQELQAALRRLPEAVAREILDKTLREAAKPLVAAMRSSVPKDSGELSDSIVASARLSPRQAGMHKSVSKDDVELFVGPGPLPYAHIVEFGSKFQQPKPYVRPAWDAGKGALLEAIKAAMTDAVMKKGGRGGG